MVVPVFLFPLDISLALVAAALGGLIWVFVLTELPEMLGIRWTLGWLAIFSAETLSIASALAFYPGGLKHIIHALLLGRRSWIQCSFLWRL
jgi:hypothetical protein